MTHLIAQIPAHNFLTDQYVIFSMNMARVFQNTCLILLYFCLYLFGNLLGDEANASDVTTDNPIEIKPREEQFPYSLDNHSNIDIKKLQTIYIPVDPNNAENTMAHMLQKKMRSLDPLIT